MPPKFVSFNGRRYCRDDATGYYKCSQRRGSPTYLHRDVWEHARGPIPDGHEVHHPHRDKHTTDPDRLVCMDGSEHARLHGAELTDEQRERARRNFVERAQPAAMEWHGSAEGRAWHADHARALILRRRYDVVCDQCRKPFTRTATIKPGRFCSNACKSAWRRASGVDDVQRQCARCGVVFTANRYADTSCCSKSCAVALRHSR